jgi:hypothetical protein
MPPDEPDPERPDYEVPVPSMPEAPDEPEVPDQTEARKTLNVR